MLNISFAVDLVSDSSLFKKSMKDSSSSAFKFFDSVQTQLQQLGNSFGFSESAATSLADKIGQQMPANITKLGTDSVGYQIAFSNMANSIDKDLNGIDGAMTKVLGESFTDTTAEGALKMAQLNEAIGKASTDSLSKMNDAMTKFTNNMDDFNTKEFTEFSKLLVELKNAKSAEDIESISQNMDKISKSASNRKDMEAWGNNIRQWAKGALGLYGIQQIFQEIIGVQNEMARSVWQMGAAGSVSYDGMTKALYGTDGATASLSANVRATTAEFLEMNRAVASKANVSLSEAAATMGELMSMRVGQLNGDLEELSGTSMLMQKALGMSAGAANRFVHSLSVVGGLGASDVRAAAQEISNVQQSLGLTEGEAQMVGDTVGKLMRQFRTFGGNAKDVAVVTKEVGKMTAAFAKAGLSAEDAGAMINKMMDPDNLQQSIMLWNQMGMSAQEGLAMMHGEGSNMAGMTEKMVSAAKNLKAQYGGNIWALKAMAEAHGMNLEQVQALSQLSAKDLATQREAAKLEEAAAAARQGMGDQLTRIKNSILVMLHGALMPFLEIMGPIFEGLAKGLNWLTEALETVSDWSGLVGWILKAGIAAGLLMILGIIPGLKGGLFSLVGGLLKKIPLVGKVTEKLGSSFANVGKQAGSGLADGIKKINQAINELDPKAGLAFGLMMLMIAGGVAIVTMSVVQLVKAVAEGNVQFGQLAGIALVMLTVMGGFVGMLAVMPPLISALGAAGSGAALGILAVGAAMLLMGAGIMMATIGIGRMVEAFAGLTGGQILGAIGTLIITFAALIVMMVLMGVIGASVGWAIILVGAAFMLMGVGVMLAALGIAKVVEAFGSLGDQAGVVAQGIVSIIQSIALLTLSAALLVGSMYLMAMGFAAASVGVGIFLGAMLLLGAVVPLLFLMGIASNKLGENIMNMGVGMAMIGDHASAAVSGLEQLKASMKEGWEGAADKAVEEISRIATALLEMQSSIGLGTMMSNVMTNIVGRVSGEGDSAKGATSSDYTGQLNTANAHLSTIANNTHETNTLLKELISETKKKAVLREKTFTKTK